MLLRALQLLARNGLELAFHEAEVAEHVAA